MRKIVAGLVLAVATAVSLSACALASPDQLSLLSVEVVKYDDQKEVHAPENSLWGFAGRDLEGSDAPAVKKYPDRLWLKIQFSTSTNLSKLAEESSYHIGTTAYFCDKAKEYPDVSYPYIFWNGVWIDRGDRDPISRSGINPGTPITYYIYVPLAETGGQSTTLPDRPYNLRQHAEDICFYIRGGNEWGLSFRSNVVVIPRAMIEAALKRSAS